MGLHLTLMPTGGMRNLKCFFRVTEKKQLFQSIKTVNWRLNSWHLTHIYLETIIRVETMEVMTS